MHAHGRIAGHRTGREPKAPSGPPLRSRRPGWAARSCRRSGPVALGPAPRRGRRRPRRELAGSRGRRQVRVHGAKGTIARARTRPSSWKSSTSTKPRSACSTKAGAGETTAPSRKSACGGASKAAPNCWEPTPTHVRAPTRSPSTATSPPKNRTWNTCAKPLRSNTRSRCFPRPPARRERGGARAVCSAPRKPRPPPIVSDLAQAHASWRSGTALARLAASGRHPRPRWERPSPSTSTRRRPSSCRSCARPSGRRVGGHLLDRHHEQPIAPAPAGSRSPPGRLSFTRPSGLQSGLLPGPHLGLAGARAGRLRPHASATNAAGRTRCPGRCISRSSSRCPGPPQDPARRPPGPCRS